MSAAAPEGQPAGSQLLRSGASLAVATMIAGVLGYVYILVLTRSLGPEQYGILGSLLGLSVVLSVASTALQLEAMRAVASDPSAPRDWLRRRGRIISIATGAVTLAAGPVIVEVLRLPTWAPVLALAALMVPQTYIGVQLGILLGAGRTGAFSLLLVLSGLSRTLAAILTAALKESPTFALWASAATGVAVLLLGALLVRAAEPPRHTSAEVATPRDWSGVWRAAVGAGALVVLLNADLLAARAVLPDRESGWYAFLTVFGRVTFWGTNFIALWVFPHEAARGSAARARSYALGAVALGGQKLRGDEACGALPAKLAAREAEGTDVHLAVGEHHEVEPAARREEERALSTLGPVVKGDATDRGILARVAEKGAQGGEVGHRRSFGRAGV